MKCYGLGNSLWVDPATGLLEVKLSDSSGMEIIEGEGLSLQESQKQPVWTTWVPTLKNMTKGNGTVTARYFNQGGLIMYSFTFTLGSTSSMGTNPGFTAPTIISDWGQNSSGPIGCLTVGQTILTDNGTINFQGNAINYVPSSGEIWIWCLYKSATYVQNVIPSATVPFTWTTGDTIQARGWYKGPKD